ncbi:MAG: hypothetical protein RSE13_24765 [Planktothrix sp. GU0601_MAG3]|nr:MAG: hypothetical protein RSE13_24765 [Planktothrix sp. GU0601_MAG3]
MVNSKKPAENTPTTPSTPATPAPQGVGNPNDYYFPNRGFASETETIKD